MLPFVLVLGGGDVSNRFEVEIRIVDKCLLARKRCMKNGTISITVGSLSCSLTVYILGEIKSVTLDESIGLIWHASTSTVDARYTCLHPHVIKLPVLNK